jgi:hypothetical protein
MYQTSNACGCKGLKVLKVFFFVLGALLTLTPSSEKMSIAFS